MYSGFSHWKWWFSIAMLNYRRVYWWYKNWWYYVVLMGYSMEFLCNHGITIANNLGYQCFINCIMVYEWNFSGILEASILFIDGIEHDGTGTCFFPWCMVYWWDLYGMSPPWTSLIWFFGCVWKHVLPPQRPQKGHSNRKNDVEPLMSQWS